MFLSLKSIELVGFKSFGKKTELLFASPIAAIVGPNGSGKSNVAEAFRFVLGEQSMKSMRSKKGEDLIWGGSPALPRMNRAGVKVVFDNSKRLLDLDFKEVVVERVVHRDGVNEYLLNGTPVRLKDVIRLLAGANIGGSGYQIISQGRPTEFSTPHRASAEKWWKTRSASSSISTKGGERAQARGDGHQYRQDQIAPPRNRPAP